MIPAEIARAKTAETIMNSSALVSDVAFLVDEFIDLSCISGINLARINLEYKDNTLSVNDLKVDNSEQFSEVIVNKLTIFYKMLGYSQVTVEPKSTNSYLMTIEW